MVLDLSPSVASRAFFSAGSGSALGERLEWIARLVYHQHQDLEFQVNGFIKALQTYNFDVSTEMYLDENGYDRDEEHQTASDLFILSPSSKAAPLSPKGFVASHSGVASVWERPRSVLHGVESTTLVAILDPTDDLRVLVGE